jgi:hypothetical protein
MFTAFRPVRQKRLDELDPQHARTDQGSDHEQHTTEPVQRCLTATGSPVERPERT